MIIDEIKNFSKYMNLNEKFKTVEKFLQENDLEEMEVGSYEIQGRDIYVNIDEYTTKESSIPEAHRNYIDIQMVLCGHEKIGYASLTDGKTEIEYNADRDIEFLKADCEFLKADSSRFFIFYPQDLHQPCITDGKSSQIKKAVFKVKI